MTLRFKFSLIFLSLILTFLISAAGADEITDEADRQMVFVDQTMNHLEQERLRQEAERQAEVNRHIAEQKRQKEAKEAELAEQLAGLSGTLSGLPEMPSFEGRFEEKGTVEEEEAQPVALLATTPTEPQ